MLKALRTGDLAAVKEWAAANPDSVSNPVNGAHDTVLHLAVRSHQEAIVRFLCEGMCAVV